MDNSKEFACKRCGNCCVITASITPEEKDRIERFLKKNKDIQEIAYKNYSITINLIELLNTLDDKCFFYDRANNKCLIYSIKPRICNLYKCSYSRDKLSQVYRHNSNKSSYSKGLIVGDIFGLGSKKIKELVKNGIKTKISVKNR